MNRLTAQYITGYVTSKIGKRLEDGRVPEFSVMSRRPGIGGLYLPMLVQALNCSAGAAYMGVHKDVPQVLQVGGRVLPLGSYIRRKLRLFFFGDDRMPKEAKREWNEAFAVDIAAQLPALQLPVEACERFYRPQSLEEEAKIRAAVSRARHVFFERRDQRAVQLAGRIAIDSSRRRL